jgi:tetraacyldisaccharide 4'-kinase
MSFKTPSFWYQQSSWQSQWLAPFAALYGVVSAQRLKKRARYVSDAKVICIGNLTAGGSGKTPVALALKELLGGKDAVYLSRGYGGSLQGPTLVSIDHSADQVGDEPMLLARAAPTIIAKDRIKGAKLAEDHHASLIIMDDGFQNPSLFKDLRICVIDGASGFGNMKCIPAGPLRQPLALGLVHADIFIVIGTLDENVKRLLPKGTPLFEASIEADISALPADYKNNSYVAFSGIAHPIKFENTLKDIGAHVIKSSHFADHHAYSAKELTILMDYAKSESCRLITTEKDAVKIPDGPWMDYIDVLPIKLKFKAESKLRILLERELAGTL